MCQEDVLIQMPIIIDRNIMPPQLVTFQSQSSKPRLKNKKIMKSLLSLVTALCITHCSFSQVKIKLEDAGKYVKDSITVCGRVAGIRFVEKSKNTPTFINIGASYPNQLLTVVIWGDVRKQFEIAPEVLFKDKEVCITGKVELYKEKLQIVIHQKEQLVIE